MRLPTVQKRNGFTLVELLVVIAIIAILMGLTVGVISKVYLFVDDTRVVSEIGSLATACEQFKSTFGRYPPAKIMLCENPAAYNSFAPSTPPAILAAYSAEYLSSVFPGLLTAGPVNWTGRSSFNPAGPFVAYVLEGEESLVYFLSGVRPGGGAPVGFNTDKSRLVTVTTGARLGPFFEFEPSRIATGSSNPLSNGLFPVYKDLYGTAYAYFYARTPGMNNYYFVGSPAFAGTGFNAAQQEYLSDCPTLTRRLGSAVPDVGYVPLWQNSLGSPPAAIQFFKADSYQIVSAGKDKLFGSGGQWNQPNPENSTFSYMNFPAPVATAITDVQSCYDNITNVANGRTVPK
jgi:prepilin-type N-terminal cleavage/methylation domain-containing protein